MYCRPPATTGKAIQHIAATGDEFTAGPVMLAINLKDAKPA
jgi:hypothetical protein